MHAMIVRFTMPEGTDWEALRRVARERAEAYYRNLPGLRSKAFIISPERREYGGQYVWETREQLEEFLRSEVFAGAVAKFGRPEVLTFEVPAYVEQPAAVGAGR